MSRTRKHRILVLVDEDLVPPDVPASEVEDEWRMEWDVVTAVGERGHATLTVGVRDDLTPIRSAVAEFRPTIVFNLLEAFHDVGVFDQNVVSYLELLKIPYTGCNPRGLTLARDKALARKLLAYHRIPFPDFFVVAPGRVPKVPKRLDYPLIVKSLNFEASIGISQASVVVNEEQLTQRVRFIHEALGTSAIVERFVDGREVYVGILGNQRLRAFPVWELDFSKMPEDSWRIATAHVKGNAEYQWRHGIDTGLARLPDDLAGRIQHLAKRTYRALEMSGYGRVDFRLDAQGRPFVIEANPNPQLARHEDFAQSAIRGDLPYERLLERILALGIQWQPHRLTID